MTLQQNITSAAGRGIFRYPFSIRITPLTKLPDKAPSFILLVFLFHAAAFAGGAAEIYTLSEKNRLAAAKSLDDRIKIYDAAFERISGKIEKDIRESRFEDAALTLSRWSALLSESLADVEANANTKKKSNRLRQYEIHLRQSITRIRALRTGAPFDLYDALTSFAEKAEETRRKFMNILFDLKQEGL